MANEKLFLPAVDNIEGGANVVVTFHGLMCLARKAGASVPFCEVGVHNDAPNHSLSITVWEVDSGFDPPAWNAISQSRRIASFKRTDTGSGPDDIVSLAVSNPRIAGVSYFQPEEVVISENDFRRMPDFESSDFYDRKLDGKIPAKFGPRVHIHGGVFYVWYLTRKKFKRHDEVKRLGKIAHLVAANIYLNEGGNVVLQVGDKSVPMPFSRDKKYLVMIDNGCPSCTDIDFDEYYKTFTLPRGKPQYRLELDESITDLESEGYDKKAKDKAQDAEDAKEAFEKFLKDEGQGFSHDDTPCGSAGFGRSDGIS